MSEPKDFVAALDSDSRRTPVRIAFLTRRTSPSVKARDEELVMTYPEVVLRVAVAMEALLLGLVLISLLWNAPLEELADPLQTPNPAKAPWYFLGLQELLHYFPPVVGGVLIPTLVVLGLVVIPYFDINIQADGFFVRNRRRKMQALVAVTGASALFFLWFEVYPVLATTLLTAGLMLLAAISTAQSRGFRYWLFSKPLSFWIMSWFLLTAVTLTVIGTFFRGAGWSWIAPWRME